MFRAGQGRAVVSAQSSGQSYQDPAWIPWGQISVTEELLGDVPVFTLQGWILPNELGGAAGQPVNRIDDRWNALVSHRNPAPHDRFTART